jgi:hypothetical protein
VGSAHGSLEGHASRRQSAPVTRVAAERHRAVRPWYLGRDGMNLRLPPIVSRAVSPGRALNQRYPRAYQL